MKNQLLTILALCILTATTMAQVPSYVPTNGLAGWWPFGGNANDESTNANNGTVTGAALTTDRSGNSNTAYVFDGVNDYISLPSGGTTSLNLTGDLTVSFWIKTTDNSGLLLSMGDNVFLNSGGYLSGINGGSVGNGKLGAATRGNWNGSSNTINNNSWVHVVYVLEGDILRIYLNNAMDNQFTGIQTPLSWTGNRVIGCRHDLVMGAATNYMGSLDDIGIWGRALNLCEIEQMYLAQAIAIPSASVTPMGATTFCQGGSVELSVPVADSYLWSTGETTQSIIVEDSDTYSVTVTNGANCSATSEAVTVTVYQNPVVSLSPLASICENASAVVLSGGSPSGGTYTVNGNPTSQLDPSSTGSGQQTVVYTYTDGNSCIGTATQQATVNPVPVVTLTGLASGYLPTDGPVQLIGSPMGGVFNGTGVSGSTFSPATAGLGTHGISYAVVNGNGCIGVSALCTTVDITTGEGIGTDNGGSGVEVYPNPANGRFNLMLEQMEGIVSAKVFDAKGREVWSNALVANGTRSQHSIDLTDQAKGIYTLQLQSAQGTLTRKLVKN